MIIFTTLRYKNFLSSGNVFTEIDLNSHKNTLIIGPNGSGKSTFLDALTFALFGKPFRKITKGNVVNSINQKQCHVEIEFTISNRSYKIVRGIKPSIFEIYCEGVMINQDAAAKDYQKYLEEHILKMNYKSFTQIVILGSASFTPFMQLSPADRRAVIEDLLDIQVFSAMNTIVKNRLQVNRESLELNRVALTSKQENKSYIEKTLRSLQVNNEEKLAELNAKKQQLEEKLKIEEAGVANRRDMLNKALERDLDLTPFKTKHTKLVTIKAKIENNRERIEKENTFYHDNDTCPTCKQAIDEDFKSNTYAANEKKIREFDDGLNKIAEQIDAVITEITHIEEVLKNIDGLKMDLASATASYKHISNSLDQVVSQIESFSVSDKTTQDSERQLVEVKHDISELQKTKEALLDERQYIDLAATLLKDGGIKTRIIKQYLPIVNKHINKYLSKMGFFVNFNINESFEETIKSRYRDEFSYNNFSEGEKLRIDLAILLTWRQIAKMKNSVNVNIIVFDEILDRAMDAQGIDEFMRLMWDMGNETNVFVISHKDAMVDRFERILQFRKVKNFSQLSMPE